MPLTTRRLEAGDGSLVRHLSLESSRFDVEPPAPGKYEPLGQEATARLLGDSRTHFLVAEDNGEVLGFLMAHELLRRHGTERMAVLYEIGVRADCRRQGIGRLLLRHFADLCKARAIRSAFVLTEDSNPEAMALYAGCGWLRERRDDVVFTTRFL